MIPTLLMPALALAVAANDSLVVSTAWLAQHLHDPKLVLLHVDRADSAYKSGHIPGARFLSYASVIANRDSVRTELPDPAVLRELFESLGISTDSRIVLYGAGPAVSRAFFTLDYVSKAGVSMLDGGLAKWRAEGKTVTRDEPAAPARGRLEVKARPEIVATAAWVQSHTRRPGTSFIDTRTDPEYVGTGEYSGLPNTGHIAGARQLQWQELFKDANSLLFRDRGELADMYNARTQRGDTVVTYCMVGYRASMTYFVARYLGLPAKLYDGSYEDWLRRGLPLVTGPAP
jgi:thiosulfate/3-mercaptopyruvate sulfurtransferase